MKELIQINQKEKMNKGITLIALVITIIVLLILAGISIATLTGENGILNKAQHAGEKTEEEQAKEKLELVIIDLQADKRTDKNYNKDEYINQKIQENEMIVNGDIIIVDGWKFQIDRSIPQIIANLGKGQLDEQIQIIMTSITSNDYVKSTIKIEITYEKEIESIIFDGKEIEVPQKQDGKYIIEKEVRSNGTYSVIARGTENKYNTASIKVNDITEDMDIHNLQDMIIFRDQVNKGATFEGKKVQIMDHINLNGSETNQWIPIGNSTTPFKGTFEGNNYTINNIYINNSEYYQALFGELGVNGKISNLEVNGTIQSSGYYIAGIVAKNYGLVEKCINHASITGSIHSGGVIADNRGTLAKSANYGSISNSQAAGGLTAANGCFSATGYIYESYNYGDVYSESWVCGGVTANNGSFDAEEADANCVGYIYNCYNFGNISGGRDRRAGIVGQIGCLGGTSYVYNCYNAGNIYGCPDILGFLFGGTSIEENNYNATTVSLENLRKKSNIVEGIIETGTYSNDVWIEDSNNINKGFPILKWQVK